ncbi:MAG: Holliday junction branch migration protein RuvA [Candidatus Humimicrobiaceae bacterium]|jgi:Holliday junction DNA helicase RuvA|nr:Holliday junction branch migration protein RuvA [Actinomycetota bacterium]MDD5600293.1 Holliday junction branch migration protein RuvA [Actinomycetota bacterium]MDY0027725.1 Holliday junction branch migration protein RuvA [Candidatus Humimicrobiaceae bacterium]
MIAKLFGKIVKKSPSSIIVRTGGIGFEVLISGKTYERIPEAGSDIELDIYTHIREDELKLVGFIDDDDKDIFLKLLGVSGISIKIALSALSIYSGQELGRIIADREVDLLRRIPGIGLKLAERIILELKNKIKEEKISDITGMDFKGNEKIHEVTEALKSLGYSPAEITKAISRLNIETIDSEKTEDILRIALKEI